MEVWVFLCVGWGLRCKSFDQECEIVNKLFQFSQLLFLNKAQDTHSLFL